MYDDIKTMELTGKNCSNQTQIGSYITIHSFQFNTFLKWTNRMQCLKCVEWISTCPEMVHLTSLDLCFGRENGIGDEGCQLLDCALMKNLTCLNMYHQSIGNKGCKIIANSSHLTNLRTLKLPFNTFDDDGLKELLEGSIMVNLTSVNQSQYYKSEKFKFVWL